MASRNTRFNPRISLLTGAAGLALAASAWADPAATLLWNNAAGGSAGTPGNWSPVGLPAAGDILNFNLAGNYAVSFPASVPVSAQQNFNFGTVSLSTLVPHTATTQLVVGLTAGSTPAVTFTGGSLSTTIISVGGNPTSTASLTITGPTADMFSTGGGGTRLGNTGNGTVTIANGGSLRSTNFVNIGSAAGSQGAVTVTGVNGAIPSELVTLNSVNGNLNIAGGGPGTLTVASGGLVDIAASAFIAPTAGVTGSATVGSVTANDSTFDIAGDLHIGHNTTAAAAGTGTLTANDGATITVVGSTLVGDTAGGTGTLTVREGARLFTGSLTIDASHGVLSHLGGIIKLTGGVLTVPNNQLVINGGLVSEQPLLSLFDSSATLAAPAGSRALTVASTRKAVFDVQANGLLTVSSGDVVVGDLAGSIGQIQLQGIGNMSIASPGVLTIGNNGRGTLLISQVSRLDCGSVQAGVGTTGIADIFVNATSSTLDIAGTLALGGTISTTSGGQADMIIGTGSPNSGTVTVTSGPIVGGVNTIVHAGSSLTINAGGMLVSDHIVRCTGSMTLAGGTIDADNLVPSGAGGAFNFTGTIVNLLQSQSGSIVNLTGPLSVGALRNESTISVGDHTLTIPGSSFDLEWFIGNCSVGPLGHVVAPDGLVLNSGKVLSGDGTIDASINNSGTITATGGGLTLNGIVTDTGEGINGTAIEFGPTGGFIGSGSFSSSTSVLAQAGSVILATGDLTMGNPSANNAFNSFGRIDVAGNSDVILRSGTRPTVHDVAFLEGDPQDLPQVRSPNGIVVNGLATGTGTIGGGLNVPCSLSGATLSPGSASQSGSLSFSCDTFMGSTTRTEIDIFDATTHDQIRTFANLVVLPSFHTVPSDITLAGTLVLRVAPEHFPTSGERHQIVDVVQALLGPDGVVNGSFASIEAPRHWIIDVVRSSSLFQPNGVFAIYCTADFDEDGTVDFFDYDAFVAAFEAGEPEADFDGDGTVDFFDYDAFVVAFEQGC